MQGTLNADGEGGAVWCNENDLLYRLEAICKDVKDEDLQSVIDQDEVVQRLFGDIKTVVLRTREEQARMKAKKKAAKTNGTDAKGKGKKSKVKKEEDDEGSPLSDLEGDEHIDE